CVEYGVDGVSGRRGDQVEVPAPGAAGAVDAGLQGRPVHGQRQRDPAVDRSQYRQRDQAGAPEGGDRQVLRVTGRRRRQGVPGQPGRHRVGGRRERGVGDPLGEPARRRGLRDAGDRRRQDLPAHEVDALRLRAAALISRHWKGIARPGRADDYVRHLESETLPQLKRLPGFVDLSILRREVDAGTEFQIVTRWTSLEAIEAFSGKDVNVAVVPPSVRELMVSYDAEVVHYEVVPRAEATPPM